ncbi:uncharacterized protein LOC107043881 [Diachasma alloeum]|uniref:uncharacterized protein LOC107043881 n=1 Tax=Diachasma alloeum TaxID=454923 RepID=UPI000738463A|nr:uncharacterized protein LOC107043881 [Diachasma alloeum]
MSTQRDDEKLLKVLRLFLLPDYNVVSTTYLDLLLTHISNQQKCDQDSNDRRTLLKKWIVEALEVWSSGEVKPCQAVTVFTIKLIGILSQDENDFDYLESGNVFEKLSAIFQLQKSDVSASVKMAYTSMLVDVISHKIGRRWVISKGLWRDMVKFAQLNHTMYVTRESHRFIHTVLNKESQNKEFCKDVILAVSEPLIKYSGNSQLHAALEELYLDQNALLCTTLDLITSIIENTMFTGLENEIADMFEELVDLEDRLKALTEACISTKFLQHILKLWALISFQIIKIGARKDGPLIDEETWAKFSERFCYIQTLLIEKKYIVEIVGLQKMTLLYWRKLNDMKEIKSSFEHQFEYQAMTLMITPLGTTMRHNNMKHEFFEMFVDKLYDVTCQPVQRLSYLIKDVMLRESLPVEQICKSSIEMILETIDVIGREVAVIAFQSMCYVLKNYIPKEKICSIMEKSHAHGFQESPNDKKRKPTPNSIFNGDPVVDNPVLLSTLLHGLAVLTQKFQFKWQDCVETICLLALAQEILNHTGTLPSLCVKALQLCKLAIQNFMPPNLALLVESDSGMRGIGLTLFKRLHDPNWEVRDSVLEVLITIAAISEDKYPAFQELLLTNDFLPLITDVALMDGESYVRASAVKFIATTIRINKLWDHSLSKMDLPEKFINLFKKESEAIVRREAVDLIKELYVYRKWPKSTIDLMSTAMTEAAVLDLHWEVKVNALNFWKHFIKSHFTDQGMLDGSFPNVTFSKEHRKIVTLNETEIKRRLNKALDDVAKHRCLGVLLVTLENDSDFEVSRSAADIIKKLQIYILKYKLNEPVVENSRLPKDSATIDSSYIKPQTQPSTSQTKSSPEKLADIIDAIVKENDAELLASIYQSSMRMDADDETVKTATLEKLSQVTRQKFLNVVNNMDVDHYIEEKRRWLKDYTVCFDSVLEDILTVYEQNGVNSMDCY